MNDHVTKPIDPDKLFATLQKWIQPVAERTAAAKSLPAAEGSPIPDAPATAAPVEDDLPESLPGFDLAAGLARLMGNKRLYRKLLLDFGASYGATAGEIRAALTAKDFERAHSLIHNLKGVAGNLAATDLQASAVAMEKLVKGQTPEAVPARELNRKLADLEGSLQQALAAVQALSAKSEQKTIAMTADQMTTVSPELEQAVVDRIKTAAEMGDVMQIKSIAEESKPESDAGAAFLSTLLRLAEDFDLDGIKKLMLDIET
jgi:HPt (histidine-containing phosphotransfer) domain-containing protein